MNEQRKWHLRQLDGYAQHDMLPLHPECWEDKTVLVDGRMTHTLKLKPFVMPELGPDKLICPERLTRGGQTMKAESVAPHQGLCGLSTTIYGTRWRNGLPQTVHIHLPLPLPQNQNHEDMRSVSSSESSEEEVVV